MSTLTAALYGVLVVYLGGWFFGYWSGNFALLLFTYLVLRLQGVLPGNPQGLAGLSPHLAFNTAISFTTNTNWQWYSGEATLSNLSQMLGLTIQNFLSAATGIALAFALFRGFARRQMQTIGNFWAAMSARILSSRARCSSSGWPWKPS